MPAHTSTQYLLHVWREYYKWTSYSEQQYREVVHPANQTMLLCSCVVRLSRLPRRPWPAHPCRPPHTALKLAPPAPQCPRHPWHP